jgi:hypothetical protein
MGSRIEERELRAQDPNSVWTRRGRTRDGGVLYCTDSRLHGNTALGTQMMGGLVSLLSCMKGCTNCG